MNKELEKWAWPILKKYQSILLLDDYILKFQYSKEVKEDEQMHSIVRFPYKDIIIRYGDTAIKTWTKKEKEELRQTLIHELVHTLTNPLMEKAHYRFVTKDDLSDTNEHLTDHITNVIVKAGI